MSRKRIELPQELSQRISIPFHPGIYREVKIASIRGGYDTVAEWLHHQLCTLLDREDLALRVGDRIETR